MAKISDSDLSFALSPEGLWSTRAVRRCADEWQPEFLLACKGVPWDQTSSRKFGTSTRAFKKLREAIAEKKVDEEAMLVEEYARMKALESLNRPPGAPLVL